ncbi:MAG TPA: 5-formyltetrahydrofolate cyclo-ligase [Clostridiales bacterium]|nr:5-formyltetrahydrofolate cyclo-ligase [Clostridiales bacterium]
MLKAKLREALKIKRNSLSDNEVIAMSEAIKGRILGLDLYKSSSNILSFISFGKEVDTKELIKSSIDYQKNIYAPRVAINSMDFYKISNLENLVTSKFGVSEPKPDYNNLFILNEERLKEKTIMIIPGLAFDSMGNRLGYGKGYYDEYLSREYAKDFTKIALAYDFQIVDEVPTDEYDLPVDYIVTPSKVITIHR